MSIAPGGLRIHRPNERSFLGSPGFDGSKSRSDWPRDRRKVGCLRSVLGGSLDNTPEKYIRAHDAHTCWTGAMRTFENSVPTNSAESPFPDVGCIRERYVLPKRS